MVGSQSSYTLAAPAIAISVVDVGPGQFNGLTFSVSSDPAGMKPEVSQVINNKGPQHVDPQSHYSFASDDIVTDTTESSYIHTCPIMGAILIHLVSALRRRNFSAEAQRH